MKNPWKRYSKINPQRDDGNRQICNTIFHALIAADFTGAEYKIILVIIDKTWGFGKNDDSISINQFAKMTNLSERTVQRSLKKLNQLRVVYLSPFGRRVTTGSPLNRYSFNKHYDTWRVEGCKIVQGCQVDHPPKADKGDIQVLARVTTGPPTKETNTKETIIKKEKTLAHFDQFYKAYPKKKSKGQAKKTWEKLVKQNKIPELSILLKAIEWQKDSQDWQENNGKYIPHPSTWLNAEGWEDEISENKIQEQQNPSQILSKEDIDKLNE